MPSGKVDNSPAWLLVALPFVLLGGTVALLMSGVAVDNTAAWVVGVAATVAVALWDSRMLAARGYDVHGGFAAILVPLYLIERSRQTKQTYAIPVAWVIVFVGYLVAGQAISNHYGPFEMNMPGIEQQIKAQVDDLASTSSTVSCPTTSTYITGDTFECTVSDGTGSLTEQVTVHANAYVTWQPVAGARS